MPNWRHPLDPNIRGSYKNSYDPNRTSKIFLSLIRSSNFSKVPQLVETSEIILKYLRDNFDTKVYEAYYNKLDRIILDYSREPDSKNSIIAKLYFVKLLNISKAFRIYNSVDLFSKNKRMFELEGTL
jgi:hypothetical protein